MESVGSEVLLLSIGDSAPPHADRTLAPLALCPGRQAVALAEP